jgi:hypothetical protein
LPDVQYPDEPFSNPSAIRIEELLTTDEAPAPPPAVREGLPRSFRMRADKHYVEMLDTPLLPGAPAASVESERATAVSPTEQVNDSGPAIIAASAQAGIELAQSLAALRACTSLLSDRGPALTSTVAANVIRAEVWRSTCLLHASRFLRGEIAATPKPVRARAVVDQILTSIEPERRLRGVTIDDRITVGESRMAVDEQLLVTALSALLMATIGLSEEGSDMLVSVSAESQGGDVVFSIGQDLAGAPPAWAADSLAVVAATHIAAASEGRITVKGTVMGTDVRVTIPRLR